MTEKEKMELLSSSDYSFLKDNKYLGDNILILAFGGSHAYGTNIPTSDIDLRGVTATTSKQLFGLENDFEQVMEFNKEKGVDSCIYSTQKAVKLFLENNPNTMEILGCRDEDYLILSPAGRKLLAIKLAFINKLAIKKFGGYSRDRIDNIQALVLTGSGRKETKLEMFKHSLDKSIESFNIVNRNDMVNLTIGETMYNGEKMPSLTGTFDNYPMVLVKSILSSMNNINANYCNVNKRNRKKSVEGLAKQMMNLCRLYIMGAKLNAEGKIETYIGGKYHDLLMDMRFEKYLTADGKDVISAFYDVLRELQSVYDYALRHTVLPDEPDFELINCTLMDIYRETLFMK